MRSVAKKIKLSIASFLCLEDLGSLLLYYFVRLFKVSTSSYEPIFLRNFRLKYGTYELGGCLGKVSIVLEFNVPCRASIVIDCYMFGYKNVEVM